MPPLQMERKRSQMVHECPTIRVFHAGPYILEQELPDSIQKLEEYAFCVFLLQSTSHISSLGLLKVSTIFFIKLTNCPFLKRYLRRGEISRDLSDCDSSLRDALGLFIVSFEMFAKSFSYSQHYRFRFKSVYLNKFWKRRNTGRRKPRSLKRL